MNRKKMDFQNTLMLLQVKTEKKKVLEAAKILNGALKLFQSVQSLDEESKKILSALTFHQVV